LAKLKNPYYIILKILKQGFSRQIILALDSKKVNTEMWIGGG